MSHASYFPENHASTHFIWALLLSFALHILAVTVLHPFNFISNKPITIINVELSPPPPPVAPPPEPPKPKALPPKPSPPVKRVPVITEPLPAPVAPKEAIPEIAPRVEPVPPSVISEPPQERTEPPAFVVPTPPPLPPPELPKPVVTQDLDAARGYYSNQLGKEFAKYKQYPRVARMRNWQGTVQGQVKLDASGAVMASTINQSSGYDVLDKQALEMVQKASPLPRPPEILRDREFTVIVPVVFRLE